MRRVERVLEVAAACERQLAFQLTREQVGRLADQVGMADAVEPRRQRRHPALLRLTTQDPMDVVVGRQRARRGVGVGRLAVVHVDDVAHCGDPLLAVRQAGIGAQAFGDLVARQAEPAAGRPGAGGILRVVIARQGRHVGEIEFVPVGIDQAARLEGNAALDRAFQRHRDDGDVAALAQPGEHCCGVFVVDADHGAIARLLAVEDVFLGRDIARHVAVPVDMVGRDVEPHRNVRAEGLE
jgi:hypothetical protein